MDSEVAKTPEIRLFDAVNNEQQKENHAADQFFRSLLGEPEDAIENRLGEVCFTDLGTRITVAIPFSNGVAARRKDIELVQRPYTHCR